MLVSGIHSHSKMKTVADLGNVSTTWGLRLNLLGLPPLLDGRVKLPVLEDPRTCFCGQRAAHSCSRVTTFALPPKQDATLGGVAPDGDTHPGADNWSLLR